MYHHVPLVAICAGGWILVAELIPNLGDVSNRVLEKKCCFFEVYERTLPRKNDANCIFGCVNSPFKKGVRDSNHRIELNTRNLAHVNVLFSPTGLDAALFLFLLLTEMDN